MIDLNEIEIAARKHWYCRSKQEDNLLRPDVLIELITRLREAERDAARYQWLRDIARHEYDVDDFFGGSGDSVDGMIDQAMKEKGDE